MVDKKIIQTRSCRFKQVFHKRRFWSITLLYLYCHVFFCGLYCFVGEDPWYCMASGRKFLCYVLRKSKDFPKIVYIVARGSFWKKWISNFSFLLIKKYVQSCFFLPVLGILRETVWVVNVVWITAVHKKNADLVLVVVFILFLNCELISVETTNEVLFL